jgi:hypothetical protein
MAAVALALPGCGAIAPFASPTPVPDEGGMGLPQQLPGESYGGPRRDLAGTLTVAGNGCVYLDDAGTERLVIFPSGSALSNPARLPDGTELRDGDAVRGSGTVLGTEMLPGGPNGYWANVTGYCAGDVPEAVVFDEISADR